MSDWLTDWLTDWMTVCLTDRLTDTVWLIDWLTLFDWQTEWHCLTDRLNDSLFDWLTDYMTDWLTVRLTVRLTDWRGMQQARRDVSYLSGKQLKAARRQHLVRAPGAGSAVSCSRTDGGYLPINTSNYTYIQINGGSICLNVPATDWAAMLRNTSAIT